MQARTGALLAGGAVHAPPGARSRPEPPNTKAGKLKAGTTMKSEGGFEYVVVGGKWVLSADADPCAPQFYTAFLDYSLATWPGPWKRVKELFFSKSAGSSEGGAKKGKKGAPPPAPFRVPQKLVEQAFADLWRRCQPGN